MIIFLAAMAYFMKINVLSTGPVSVIKMLLHRAACLFLYMTLVLRWYDVEGLGRLGITFETCGSCNFVVILYKKHSKKLQVL